MFGINLLVSNLLFWDETFSNFETMALLFSYNVPLSQAKIENLQSKALFQTDSKEYLIW